VKRRRHSRGRNNSKQKKINSPVVQEETETTKKLRRAIWDN
jgi:hypothetical protein